MTPHTGFVPPPYPQDQIKELISIASRHAGGAIDLTIGAPTDRPPMLAVNMLADPDLAKSYPPSFGTPTFRAAASHWLRELVGVDLAAEQFRATVGSKEFVASLPGYLRLRNPSKQTVLYPGISYPTYAMGAKLGGCRAVPVPMLEDGRMDLEAIDPQDVEDALMIWVNSPANPTGRLDDVAGVVAWGREHGVLVVSDECYIEFFWNTPPVSALQSGATGVISVHSLSKRSNFAGLRSGFYAGDAELIDYLGEVRKHAGLMQPGPVLAAATAALRDEGHVGQQRTTYLSNMTYLVELLAKIDIEATVPAGAFYLWVKAPTGNGWELAQFLAEELGIVGIPGELYGSQGSDHVRLAAVQPLALMQQAEDRI